MKTNLKDLTDFLDNYTISYTIENDIVVAKNIDLSCNNISELPESFGNLKCNRINLSYNNIIKLPESIGNLKCDCIYLVHNKIRKIPENFGNLKCNYIYLSDNEICELPHSIGNLKCIYIDLDYNKISELPESFGNLKCIEICLRYNNISELPDNFCNLKCNYIYLSNNNINKLPESIGNLKCNHIYLDHNNISELPESFSNLKCNYISLYNTKLTTKFTTGVFKKLLNNLYINICLLVSEIKNQLKFNTPIITTKHFEEIEITDEYIYCDGILTWLKDTKKLNEYIIYLGEFDNYVVTKDNLVFAHGNSIRQAIADLLFKLSDRDASKYKSLKLDDQISIEEAIVMYRTITAACSYGVESFMFNKSFNDTISINEINSLLKNDFGADVFRKFFNIH